MATINFDKYADGLAPCIVQDAITLKVLMLGFMNKESYATTLQNNKITFYSRSKKGLWTKGEESGNFLHVKEVLVDCDQDTILIKANPAGPVCHTGADTCFNEANNTVRFLDELEGIIAHRKMQPSGQSYTASLFAQGINKIAQKVGEEAVETIIEAKDNNDELFKNEAADLLFHYMILLQVKGFTLKDIEDILKRRHIG